MLTALHSLRSFTEFAGKFPRNSLLSQMTARKILLKTNNTFFSKKLSGEKWINMP